MNGRRQDTYIRADSSTPRCTTVNTGVRTQTTLGEALVEQAVVLTACEDLIGLNDSVSCVQEAWHALLQLHAVDNESIIQVVSVPNKRCRRRKMTY